MLGREIRWFNLIIKVIMLFKRIINISALLSAGFIIALFLLTTFWFFYYSVDWGEKYDIEESYCQTVYALSEVADSVYAVDTNFSKFVPDSLLGQNERMKFYKNNEVNYYNKAYFLNIPFYFHDPTRLAICAVYSLSLDKMRVVFMAIDAPMHWPNIGINSSSLGFKESWSVCDTFESQILGRSGLQWKDSTPIYLKIAPIYMWTKYFLDWLYGSH